MLVCRRVFRVIVRAAWKFFGGSIWVWVWLSGLCPFRKK